MATISRIKPGQVLYTVTRQQMGNTTIRRGVLHSVVVKEVDPEGQYVIASWNSNVPRKFYEREVAKWKVKKPEPRTTTLGIPNY